jgi:hypothetical protein
MPRPGSFPYQSGRRETLHITAADGRRFCFNVGAGEYSVTVYSDGTFGIVMPEHMRPVVTCQTGSESVCIPAVCFSIER